MRFIVELEGVICDIAAAWHLAHKQATLAVGWSSLDQATFWRTVRTKGDAGNLLPGAKPAKFEAYRARFAEALASDEVVAALTPQPGVPESLAMLRREGECIGVSLMAGIEKRNALFTHSGARELLSEVRALNPNPRGRPIELKALSDGDPRTVVVASSDVLVRSADAAALFCTGVSTGPCTPARLHQAGARLVFSTLTELADASQSGASRLVQAGLPPERLC